MMESILEKEDAARRGEAAKELLKGTYLPKKIESVVRSRWTAIDLRSKIHKKFDGKEKLGYVEGPPTLNGQPHIGHLRGRMLKDLWYRYSTLRGLYIDFRGGWDCQGLPVELEAEKELGLTGNKMANLKELGGEQVLVEACKKMLSKYHKVWKESDDLLGLCIDDSKAYWTYLDTYIEREWAYLKSAWDNKVLDEGFRVTPFCPSCQTSLSASEVGLGGYENLEDPSMYFKMKVKDQEGTYLIAWTTMPFTVITDELVGVKPDSMYCYVKINLAGGKSERWILGKDRLEPVLNSELHVKDYSVEKQVKGIELEGIGYEHPLSDIVPKQVEIESKSQNTVHSIVAEDFVDDTTGSGLVHMSPANGEDDYEVATRRGIPTFNPIDGEGNFNSDAGFVAGLFLRDADTRVRDALEERGLLLKYGKIKHEYPVCWRSGHRLLWLARRGYFYFVDRLGEKAVEAAEKVEYFYDQPRNRFVEIIKEKRPWCISRERVWGNPLPIWKCTRCKGKIALFSRKEIVARAKNLPDGESFELHRPWVDRIVIPCEKCGGEMHREPFVLDTWHNSGAAPYASLSDSEYRNYIPVPFLTEAIDQTRGWAYSLLIENVLLNMKPAAPYRAFLFQGFVLNEQGEKMSKSKGNFLAASDLLRNESVDVIRLYLTWKASPIDSINFSLKEMMTRPFQILNTLYHMHLFYLQNSSFDKFDSTLRSLLKKVDSQKKNLQEIPKHDRWLLSRIEELIDIATANYSNSRYDVAARGVERFLINDLSQTYVPIIRGEMWQEDEKGRTRREQIYTTLGFALLVTDKILHPIAPFLTDFLSREAFGVESLLLEDWPSPRAQFRDEKLEAEFDILTKFVSVTNAARMKVKLKRRWPLRRAYFLASDSVKDLILENKGLLLEQANLADIVVSSNPDELPLRLSVKPNYELLAPRAKQQMNEVATKISSLDAIALYNELSNSGKATLPGGFELSGQDVKFSFEPKKAGYVTSENFGIIVALDATRDDELMSEGLLRDIARNIQALRKERGFNPTDVLQKALVARLGDQNLRLLQNKKDQLAFLVRTREVELASGELSGTTEGWSSAEIDGTEILINIY